MRDDAVSVRGTKGDRTPASGTVSADRVADVLLTFAGTGGSLGVSEISRRLGLSKAVVYRILRSLVSRRLLSVDEAGGGRYRLGPAAATLGARALRDLDLRENALPVLRRLQHESGETATVSELVGVSRVYLDQVSSLKEIKMTVEIGRPFPLHAGASSRTILAFASEATASRIAPAMQAAFEARGVASRSWTLDVDLNGAQVEPPGEVPIPSLEPAL